MVFEPLDYDQLNETDVREEILAPLLRELGYRAGTNNNIIREQSLRYPRTYIGRKDVRKDPELRGKADYIAEAERKIRWTIEAKSPTIGITTDEIEQAYTYANHPEVRAVYFCVCNGRELRIYQTTRGPDADPLLVLLYEQFNESFHAIENLLSPASLLRDYPDQELDFGLPIGPGLRSIVRITGGHITYLENSWNLLTLKGLTLAITGGAVERDETGQLIALLKTQSPFLLLQRLNERLGLSDFEVLSNDNVISTDPARPTEFSSVQEVIIPAGEKALDLQTWKEVQIPRNFPCRTYTRARGIAIQQDFVGDFYVQITFLEVKATIDIVGKFEIHVA